MFLVEMIKYSGEKNIDRVRKIVGKLQQQAIVEPYGYSVTSREEKYIGRHVSQKKIKESGDCINRRLMLWVVIDD